MKKLIIIFFSIFIITQVIAQEHGLNYQSIILDLNSLNSSTKKYNYLPDQEMIVRFTLYNEQSKIEYQEEHEVISNEYGIISVAVGQGVPTKDSPNTITEEAFRNIDWHGKNKNIRVEIAVDKFLNKFVQIDYQTQYYVPYAYHRDITATGNMLIEERTNLNHKLNVNNESSTKMTGELNVTKESTLNDSVEINKPAYFNNAVTIKYIESGEADDKEAYALRINSEQQGILVKIEDTRSYENTFVAFQDNSGTLQGRIRGNTALEAVFISDYLYNTVLYVAQMIVQVGSIALAGVQVAYTAVMTLGMKVKWAKLVIEIVNTAILAADIIGYNVFYFKDLGVAYDSRFGDYAEWLPLLDTTEVIMKGEVVGVFGGKITKNIENAEQILVVSHNPAFVGNVPNNKADILKGKNVGFIGQVPVWTLGKVKEGDYIVAYKDGKAIAVSPNDLTLEMTDKIVGKAWQSSDYEGEKLINTVIGIDNNEEVIFARQNELKLQNLDIKTEEIDAQMKVRTQMLEELVPNYQEIYEQEKQKLQQVTLKN